MAHGLNNILSILGAGVAAYGSFRLLDFLWLYVLRPSSLTRYLHGSRHEKPEEQPWALVTGSSDGIGLGFAQELCSRGFNIILHGRNPEKLAGIKVDLLRQWPKAQVRLAVLNAYEFTEETIDAMVGELAGLNITALINNVGGSPPARRVFRPLSTLGQEEIDQYISMNARFPTILTAKLLPQLSKNGPALVINVGSFVGMLPAAYLTVYSGSKGFNAMWGESLFYEMIAEAQNIEVLNLFVGAVQNQWDRSPTTFFRPSARQFAKSALRTVGCGRGSITPHPAHALQVGALRALPEFLKKRVLVSMSKDLQQKEAEMLSKEK